MFKKLFGKDKLDDKMIGQINELFLSNYKKYHYDSLINYNGLRKLLSDATFDCVLLVEEDKVCGFAGFYLKSKENDVIQQYLLAHLLVDATSRGKGYGKLLEDSRLEVIENIKREKVIYASCVEKPMNSINMKLGRGFFISGFRYRYRNGSGQRENALVLTKVKKKENIICRISTQSEMTKRILKAGNDSIEFVDNYNDKSLGCYNVVVNRDENSNRTIYEVEYNQKGHLLSELVFEDNESSRGYTSIYVRPSIVGFCKVDEYLIQHYFYPICYLPYVYDYYGVLEYQYLPDGINKVIMDKNVSSEGRNFLKYIAGKEEIY